MRRMKTVTKNMLSFSLYSLLLIVIIGGIFSVASYTSINRNIKKELLFEAEEVIEQHLDYQNGQITYKQSGGGLSISRHLQIDGVSALIFNQNLQLMGAFGLFEYGEDDSAGSPFAEEEDFLAIARQTLDNGKVEYATERHQGAEEFIVLAYPVVYQGETIGVIEIGKQADTIKQLLNTNGYILLTLLPIGLMLSGVFGYLQSRASFRPVHTMLARIRDISSARLDQKLPEDGHPDDDLVLLVQEFNSMMDRLAKSIGKQKQFVANASHELKTPLTRAISTLEVALLECQEHEDMALVRDDLFDMSRLIENLLFLARSEETTLQKGTQKVSLREVVQKALGRYQNALRKKAMEVNVSVAEGAKVNMSAEHAQMLIANLVSNAIKYSKDKGKMEIKAKQAGGTWQLVIKDQGIGMTGEELEHVFERFYRGKKGRSRAGGTGIGMSIVKDICDLYQIEIELHSKLDKGTQVTLKF